MKAEEHTDMSRLKTVDKTKADFLDKVGLYDSLPLHDVQELLKAMKFLSHFKSLNYALALTCIREGHELLHEKVFPFLLRSNADCARNLTVLDPITPAFARSWLKKLLKPTPSRNLTQTQKRRIFDALQHFNETELQVMHDLIKCYVLDNNKSKQVILDTLPLELRHVLYKYAFAV